VLICVNLDSCSHASRSQCCLSFDIYLKGLFSTLPLQHHTCSQLKVQTSIRLEIQLEAKKAVSDDKGHLGAYSTGKFLHIGHYAATFFS
jgi:hypothetical protein